MQEVDRKDCGNKKNKQKYSDKSPSHDEHVFLLGKLCQKKQNMSNTKKEKRIRNSA